MRITPTKYWPEFLRYFHMAKEQQERSNLGREPHELTSPCPLMQRVTLYDVVERRYAGFTQVVLDCLYGTSDAHPYARDIADESAFIERIICAKAWDQAREKLDLETTLMLFLIHRLAGSGINYAKQPSGYHNTILPSLAGLDWFTAEDMGRFFDNFEGSKFTSGGYQFPKFPKNPKGGLGGEYFIEHYAPTLANELANFLMSAPPPGWDLREVGEMMFNFNRSRGLSAYKFQYAAVVSDIADFLPEYVNRSSLFYYGSNARECMMWLAEKPKGVKADDHLDMIAMEIMEQTGCLPYNSEDVCCDFIRWIENFVRLGHAYDDVDLDSLWNCSGIDDHPHGRQKKMIELGLVESFNSLDYVATHSAVIDRSGLTKEQYIEMANA